MKKQQLKTGMIVQLRDGWRGLVLKGCSFYFPFTNSSNYLVGTDNNDLMARKYQIVYSIDSGKNIKIIQINY